MSQSRRTVMQAVGAGVLTQIAAGEARAQGAAQAQAELWSGEYWANKGDVKLAMYRKRVGAPKAGEPPLPVPEPVPLSMQAQPPRYLTARDALRIGRWKSVNSTPAP